MESHLMALGLNLSFLFLILGIMQERKGANLSYDKKRMTRIHPAPGLSQGSTLFSEIALNKFLNVDVQFSIFLSICSPQYIFQAISRHGNYPDCGEKLKGFSEGEEHQHSFIFFSRKSLQISNQFCSIRTPREKDL